MGKLPRELRRHRISLVSRNFGLLPRVSVIDNVERFMVPQAEA